MTITLTYSKRADEYEVRVRYNWFKLLKYRGPEVWARRVAAKMCKEFGVLLIDKTLTS